MDMGFKCIFATTLQAYRLVSVDKINKVHFEVIIMLRLRFIYDQQMS